jgi:hypothetical protein
MVEETPKETPECTCPNLINGHHPGCPLLGKKKPKTSSYCDNADFDDDDDGDGDEDFGYGDFDDSEDEEEDYVVDDYDDDYYYDDYDYDHEDE